MIRRSNSQRPTGAAGEACGVKRGASCGGKKDEAASREAGSGERRNARFTGGRGAVATGKACGGRGASVADGRVCCGRGGQNRCGGSLAVTRSDYPWKSIHRKRTIPEADYEKVARAVAKKTFFWSKVIPLFLYGVLFVGLGAVAFYLYDAAKTAGDFSSLATEFTLQANDTDASQQDKGLPPYVDFAGLKEVNAETAAWVSIPGTSVDYPVMAAGDQDKYLHMAFDGSYSLSGSIFVDYQNSINLSSDDHIVLYGHHMNSGIMFSDVSRYQEDGFFDEHRVGWLVMPDTTYRLRPVGCYITYGEDYMARQISFESHNDFQSYLDGRLGRCDLVWRGDYDRRTLDKLVTLVTCTNYDNKRVVVECIVDQEFPTASLAADTEA